MEGVRTSAGILWNGHTAPALCLDLDGTVRFSKTGDFINGPEDVAIYPLVEERIWEYRDRGFLVFGISNQGGVAHGFKTTTQAEEELQATFCLFKRNPFHIVKLCYHHPQGNVFPYNYRSLCRKPGVGMLAIMEEEAFEAGYVVDWDRSVFVGDRQEDLECAHNAGIPFVWGRDFNAGKART